VAELFMTLDSIRLIDRADPQLVETCRSSVASMTLSLVAVIAACWETYALHL
jgi:hypothetical protein